MTEERRRQGKGAGWRPLAEALARRGEGVAVRLVQEALSAQKAAHRQLDRRRMALHRVSTDVLARDAVWAQDATRLSRGTWAEVVRDVASTCTLCLALGPPARSSDVVARLEATRRQRGGLPLVWQTDNGSAYTSEEVAGYLARHRVIHLRSRVRTPTDNPSIEHGIGELKQEAAGAFDAEHLGRALWTLNEGRLRAARGYLTAAQYDAALPRAIACVERRTFYADACSAIERSLELPATPRARRTAVREAIWGVLEQHGLARRRAPKAAERPAALDRQIR